MADSATNLDLISSGQSGKEVTANDLFDAGSPATLLGRRASTTAGLTWGYYGGVLALDDGTLQAKANGTVALTDDATNYVELDTVDGSVDVNTTAWTSGKRRLYAVVTSGGVVTTYTDWRTVMDPSTDPAAADVSIADAGGNFTSTDVEGALAELADALGGVGSGTVTSVDLTMPAEFSVSGNPVTTSGTLAVSKATQSANTVYAGPASGGAAAPGFRALESADLPAQPFDASAFYPGIPTASVILLRVPIARAVTFPANFAGSYGKASANATGSTAFDIQKNGASVGTMTFGAGSASATFTSSGGASVSFSAGDVLGVIAPATPDATLADVGLVLAGTR